MSNPTEVSAAARAVATGDAAVAPDAPAATPRTIAVIDGNSLMHRAFHAVPPTMTAPDGTPTNALFGFLSMFVKMVETFHPDGVICAFDKGKPLVRMEMLPQYKAQRPPMDPALRPQFPLVKDLLRHMDVPVVELEGWEGDDILGTLARRGEQAGYNMYLITGDRDMYQLSTDHVHIVATHRGMSDVSIMTPESVEDLYHGITPELVPDFYGLKGDSSDNIPGVPGIGPKKASALIVQYGSLDEVVAHADEVKGKMGENLRAHIDDALLSREVATIRTDAPIELDFSDARFPTFDAGEVRAAFSALGFTGMTKRILALSDAPTEQASGEQVSVEPPIEGDEAVAALRRAIDQQEWIGAAEGDNGPSNTLFSMGCVLWLSTGERMLRFECEQAQAMLALLVREGRLASGDVKALLHLICPYDSSEPALIEAGEVDPARIWDVGVAGYLLDSARGNFSPETLLATYDPGTLLPEATDELPQAALDALASRLLVPVLEARLAEDSSDELFHSLEMPLLPVLLDMERTGMHADASLFAEQSAELGVEVETMVKHIHEEAGESFNVDSPMQLSRVLFDTLGLPTAGLKKTKRGYYSTNAQVLEDLSHEYQIVADVLEYRERAKIKSTYLDALPGLIRGDGRIHTTLNQTVAATGRLSSSDPNLQNIPTRSELGHRVRRAFTVPEGCVFLACDYSQIELRLLAHLSGDEHLIQAFCEGEDFHAETAARVFGVPVAEVTPALRSRAKAVNFGIVYGQQAYGLSQSLKISRAEAQEMIDRYYEAYPGVRAFLDGQVAFAHQEGWVSTMYGRKRHIAELAQRNRQMVAFGERTAMNHPMQGSAADIIKIAMVQVRSRLAAEGLKSRLVLQIHDELDFEVPIDELETLSALVREVMEGVVELSVPLIAEVSYGPTWAEAK
jgi:DNA polymerase-1